MDAAAPITSRKNPLVAAFRRAHDGEDRERFVVEGIRFLEEAVEHGAKLDLVLAAPRAVSSERGAALVRRLRERGVEVRDANDEVLDAAASTRTSPGIAALARRREATLDALFETKPPFVVAVAGLSDPGNLGSLVRTADAAGATGFAVTKESCSPWNDKALRATAGSIFRLPLASSLAFEDLANAARTAGVRIVAASAAAGEEWHRADLRPPLMLVLGSEGFGIPDEVRAAADLLVRIPLRHGVESLNVAAAGAILCFETARQAGAAT